MAPTQAAVHRAWLSLAQAWPVDRLRPKLQFGAAIGAAAQRIFDHPNAVSPLSQPSTSSTTPASAAAGGAVGGSGRPALSAGQCVKGEEGVLALERLLKNDALNRFPMSDLTLRPASFPSHYDRIRDGIEQGLKGEAKQPGLFDRFKWK